MTSKREDKKPNQARKNSHQDKKSSQPAAKKSNAAANPDDVATEAMLNRLEKLTGGEDQPPVYQGAFGREIDKLDASTEEEVDALRVNLEQDDAEIRNPRYGTGLVADEVAQERIAGFTEVGPDAEDRGAKSVVPGREDTSAVLRRKHPKTVARSEDVVEGNLDEPRDQEVGERKVDEGTAA